jgi:hypothetical protein
MIQYKDPVYTVLEKKINDHYVIERTRLPFLKVLYNPGTKKGKLYSFFSGTMPDGSGGKRSITKQDVNAAVKETIAWAKEHITND